MTQLLLALFVLLFSTTGAWAQEPTSTPSTLVPQTIFVTMALSAPTTDPEEAANATRGCMFAATHVRLLGYTVANYCNGGGEAEDSILPQYGDPVVFLVFTEGDAIEAKGLQRALPPQAVGGLNAVALLSAPFTDDTEGLALVDDQGSPFTAAVIFPGEDPGRMARIFVRCLFEAGQTGFTFEEATTCWSRVSVEDRLDVNLRIFGGWDSLFNGAQLVYGPRSSPTERATSQTARELRRYDEQQRRKQQAAAQTPPVKDEASQIAKLESPPPVQRKVNVPKVTLVVSGGALAIVGGVQAYLGHTEARSLAEGIANGEYGVEGDPRLVEPIERYNALGRTQPWWYAMGSVGLGAVTVGIALPNPNGNNTESSPATVYLSPTGVEVRGSF